MCPWMISRIVNVSKVYSLCFVRNFYWKVHGLFTSIVTKGLPSRYVLLRMWKCWKAFEGRLSIWLWSRRSVSTDMSVPWTWCSESWSFTMLLLARSSNLSVRSEVSCWYGMLLSWLSASSRWDRRGNAVWNTSMSSSAKWLLRRSRVSRSCSELNVLVGSEDSALSARISVWSELSSPRQFSGDTSPILLPGFQIERNLWSTLYSIWCPLHDTSFELLN